MPANLDTLPAELLLDIADFIQPSTRASLRLVSRYFQYFLPGNPSRYFKTAPLCEQLAWNRARDERENINSRRRQCVLCNAVHPIELFRANDKICRWHDAWFMGTSLSPFIEKEARKKLVRDAASGRSGWVALKRMYCVHSREVIGWYVFLNYSQNIKPPWMLLALFGARTLADCFHPSVDRHVATCGCECDSCGHFEMMCYMRLLPEPDCPRTWELTEDEDGKLCVLETRGSLSGGFGTFRVFVALLTEEANILQKPLRGKRIGNMFLYFSYGTCDGANCRHALSAPDFEKVWRRNG